MNSHLRKLGELAAKDTNLGYHNDSYTSAVAKQIVRDLKQEFGKIRWIGEDEGWNKAIEAVTKEISTRYGVS
jgi:hypothetical protein